MSRACSDTNCYSQGTNNEIYRRGLNVNLKTFLSFEQFQKLSVWWTDVCELLWAGMCVNCIEQVQIDVYSRHKCKEHKGFKNFSGGFVVPPEIYISENLWYKELFTAAS